MSEKPKFFQAPNSTGELKSLTGEYALNFYHGRTNLSPIPGLNIPNSEFSRRK